MGNRASRQKEPDSAFTFINPPGYRFVNPGQIGSVTINVPEPIIESVNLPVIASQPPSPPIILPGFTFEYGSCCEFVTDTECCICFSDYGMGMLMQMLPCNHILHKPCLIEWYRKSPTCPMCRNSSV